jgi:hypothetical protein
VFATIQFLEGVLGQFYVELRSFARNRFCQAFAWSCENKGVFRFELLDDEAFDLMVVVMDVPVQGVQDRLDDVVDVPLHRFSGKIIQRHGDPCIREPVALRKNSLAGLLYLTLPALARVG